VGWNNVTTDGIVTSKPAWLHLLAITVAETGNGATIYEGQDAETGRKIIHLETLANRSFHARFAPPLKCDRGIYVALDDDCEEALVHWTPQSEE